MNRRHALRSLPGLFATLLIVVNAVTAASSGIASLFYEGWGQPFPRMLGYVTPALVLVALGLVALRWPLAGGLLLLVGVLGAGAWWLQWQIGRQIAPLEALIVTALMLVGPVILAALLFLFEARHRRLLRREGVEPSRRWLARHWREVLLLAAPALAVAVPAVRQLPGLLARQDDGQRGARTIDGNGVSLVWAPQGPGWNWQTADSEYPEWQSLASHGAASLERCAYLNEDGTALLAEPARLWRMPTADEIARSLTRGGLNAGCAWDGRSHHAACRTPPDKETPLWAPDQAPIYYWTSQGAGPSTAYAVNYTGGISEMPRAVRLGGVGFRCVKQVPAGAP